MSIEGNEGNVRYFHSTTASAAEAILATGFRDAEGKYMLSITIRGVFISDLPVDENGGASSEVLLEVLLPESLDLSDYEIVAEGGGDYREWCVPAALLNKHAHIRVIDEEAANDLRFWLNIPEQWPEPCPSCHVGPLVLVQPDDLVEGIEIGQCPSCDFQSMRLAPQPR